MPQTHLQKELTKKSIVITLLTAFDQIGFPHFYFYAIKASKLKLFNAAIQNKDFGLEKYGVIIEQGFGIPSDEIWQKMNAHFGLEKDKTVIINTGAA